jgi:gliding motility-associated-like protein
VDTFLWPAPEFTFVDTSMGAPIARFWDFGDGMTAHGSTVTHRYFFPGTFTVTQVVSDHLGCVDSATTKIVIREEVVQIPNIFTPNGDGANDQWCMDLPTHAPAKIRIYDRNGMLIFESVSPKSCWNGRSNTGARSVPGQYFYVISIGDRVYHGSVTLME